MRNRLACSIVVATVLAACGGSNTDETTGQAGSVSAVPSTVRATGPTVVTTAPAPTELDPAELDLDDIDPSEISIDRRVDHVDLSAMNEIADRTVVLIDQFGVDGAFDALMFALARGYAVAAVDAAVAGDRLNANGTIEGVQPSMPPSALLELPSAARGLRSQRYPLPGDKLTMDELRDAARTFSAVAEKMTESWDPPEIATAEGVAVLHAVQLLARAGLSGDQIINAIVLGYGGMEQRILQVGMGSAAVCYMVVIGGRAEPIANDSGCDRYRETDHKLRAAFTERGYDYPSCDQTSIADVYDACRSSATADEPADSTPAPSAVEPASWEGPIALDPTAGTLVDSFIAIDLAADGTYTLTAFVETTREAYDCSWSELQTAEATGQLNADGTEILFEGTYADEVVGSSGDCVSSNDEVATTYHVTVDGNTLSGSPFPHTTFTLASDP